MRRSPKLHPSAWDGAVAALILLLAAVCGVSAWGQAGGTGELTIVVDVDGEEALRCPLAEFPAGRQVYSANGYTLYVSLDAASYPDTPGVRVAASDCPTQDCVHTGAIIRGGQSIVCLPARVIITLEGGPSSDGGPDLVVG